MNFLKKLGELIANPVRGVGRILRGNIKEGLGDIAGTARVAAPFIPGLGIPAGLAIGAADDLLHDRGLKTAALNAGTSFAASKVASVLAGKSGGAANALPAEKVATPSMATAGPQLANSADGMRQQVAGFLAEGVPQASARVGSFAPDAGRAVAGAVAGNTADPGFWGQMTPYEKGSLALRGVGGIADAYGAYRQGQVEDRMMEMSEEDRRRQMEREARRDASLRKSAQYLVDNWRQY